MCKQENNLWNKLNIKKWTFWWFWKIICLLNLTSFRFISRFLIFDSSVSCLVSDWTFSFITSSFLSSLSSFSFVLPLQIKLISVIFLSPIDLNAAVHLIFFTMITSYCWLMFTLSNTLEEVSSDAFYSSFLQVVKQGDIHLSWHRRQ